MLAKEGSMNVPNIGQGSGSVVTLSRPQPDTDVQLGSLRESGSAPAEVRDVQVHEADVAFTRIGWFDANGDGRIDSRSSLSGGDGTILLPHSVKAPTYSRVAQVPCGAASDAKQADAVPANDVQTRQAVSAYQRYGQPSTPASTDQPVS
jgi:hypothetical protein